jgi:MraZ protein
VFRGVAQLNLDSKGRLAVPSRFRDALITQASGHLVVTADSDRCLLIYPLPDWEPIEHKLMSLSSFNAQIRELQRRLVGYAEDVVMDATGRCAATRSSTKPWCWSGRATNSSCGTRTTGTS